MTRNKLPLIGTDSQHKFKSVLPAVHGTQLSVNVASESKKPHLFIPAKACLPSISAPLAPGLGAWCKAQLSWPGSHLLLIRSQLSRQNLAVNGVLHLFSPAWVHSGQLGGSRPQLEEQPNSNPGWTIFIAQDNSKRCSPQRRV